MAQLSINFVVETGVGLSNATSYATREQYRQYWLDRGVDIPVSETDQIISGLLNEATEYIDTHYRFLGYQSTLTQALAWPRIIGGLISSNQIPREVVAATCYLAGQAKNGALCEIDDGVSSETYGPVSKTYRSGKTYPLATHYLQFLTASGAEIQRVN